MSDLFTWYKILIAYFKGPILSIHPPDPEYIF
jgi:hypothetical protein